jgi:hypothetical protein
VADLYLDEDLSNDLGPALTALGHDAVHARDIGRNGLGDASQLAHAIAEHRILVTANARDFRLLHEALILGSVLLCPSATREHPGIIAMPNPNAMPAQRMAELLDERLRRDDPAALQNRFLRWETSSAWEDLSVPR